QMTEDNIRSGDPMGVYKSQEETDMFFFITFNNLFVAFRTFLLGAFAMVGTVAMLLYNGVMVGSFQYFFIERDLFAESFLTIWVHGTLEISAIIIAGAAGLVMGSGWLFPGTYTRLQAFQASAVRGLKIMLGITPVFVLAAFIEGFITRYTDVPDLVRALIIAMSFVFILTYYVLYPMMKARRGFDAPLPEKKFPPTADLSIVYRGIRSTGELFTDAFAFFRSQVGRIGTASFGLSLAGTTIYYFLGMEQLFANFGFDDSYTYSRGGLDMFFYYVASVIRNLYNFFALGEGLILGPIMLLSFTTLGWLVFRHMDLGAEPDGPAAYADRAGFWRYSGSRLLKGFLAIAVLLAIFYIPHWTLVWLILLGTPWLVSWHVVMHREGKGPFSGWSQLFGLINGSAGKFYGLFFLMLLVGSMFFVLIGSPVSLFFVEVLSWSLPLEPETVQRWLVTLYTFLIIFGLNLVFPLLFISNGVLYFTMKETTGATDLKDRIETLGQQRKAYGVEYEG
ncbi:MAG: stage II sporulation protein M, partial [Bacteroidota bacterium]